MNTRSLLGARSMHTYNVCDILLLVAVYISYVNCEYIVGEHCGVQQLLLLLWSIFCTHGRTRHLMSTTVPGIVRCTTGSTRALCPFYMNLCML